MAKVLNAYRLITAATIKANADIPNQADMTVVGTTVECVDITTTKIKNVIGHTNNKLSELCTAAGINHWSGFGPTKRTISGSGAAGEIVNSDPTNNYKEGDFAGYNHAAMTPGWHNKSAVEQDLWIDSGSNPTFYADIDIGEVRYYEDLLSHNIQGLVLVAYEYGTSNILAWGTTDLDDCGTGASLSATGVGGWSLQKHITLKVFFVNALTGFDGSQIVCQVPNVDPANLYVKIKAATYSQIDAGWNYTSYGLNLALVTASLNQCYSTTYQGNLLVKATLYNWLNQQVGQVTLFDGWYDPYDDITASGTIYGSSIPAYGYYCLFTFEASS